MVVSGSSDRSEIVFFDIETTVPTRPGQGFGILEFGSILVCPRKLVELESYSTLLRPTDLSLISNLSVRSNGISKDAVLSSPSFAQIADRVYDILHGRIWAGHNILRFDCARIREAFAEISRPPPEPKGTIDSLALLTQRFGRRAGDMKMATLATYFGLGQQTHRSLDDVRMNLEVLKYCATVLFLESSLPDVFTENSWVSPNAITRSRSNGKVSPDGMVNTPSSSVKIENLQTSFSDQSRDGNHPILSLMTPNTADKVPDRAESNIAGPDPFDLGIMIDEVERESLRLDETDEEESGSESESSTAAESEAPSCYAAFLKPVEVSTPSIRVSLVPFYRGTQRIQILHKDITLQLRCNHLKVRFGINRKFVDFAGRPRLNFVVDATPDLCEVLDACDKLAQRLSLDSGSSSEWRPVLTKKAGFSNSPTMRLQIPTVAAGNVARWVTEIYEKESSTTPQRLVFSRFDVEELDTLLTPGTFVDVYLSLDPYDYQQNAGIRLVAKKLIVHTN
ncbi:protein NEN1-like [Rhododendron vialii]|uniref:protein NEN1-like n=1 Tax=Rhododendron vialii TaxID=182163 RepID=UPI00265E628A|nr:protein NEN1-like [Rhododendron vialii]